MCVQRLAVTAARDTRQSVVSLLLSRDVREFQCLPFHTRQEDQTAWSDAWSSSVYRLMQPLSCSLTLPLLCDFPTLALLILAAQKPSRLQRARGSPTRGVLNACPYRVSSPLRYLDIDSDVMERNEDKVEQFRSGKTKLQGFFVGQAVALSGGKADPELTGAVARRLLEDVEVAAEASS